MALYFYRALTKDGNQKTGTLNAPTTNAAQDNIKAMGLYPIYIGLSEEQSKSIPQYIADFFSKSISLKEKILFTKQLATLLKSGVALFEALDLLQNQFTGKMQSIIIKLKDTIAQGKSLADGLSLHKNSFENIYIQLVRAGEATGKLETILERITHYLEQRETIQKKVSSAMQYPLIQLAIVGLVVIALLTFVVPQLSETFQSQGAQLPLTTRILLALSGFIQQYWIILIVSIIAGYIGFLYWASTKTGALTLDTIKLKIPIVRFFSQMNAVTQFCRTLGMLIESGVNLSQALDIVVNIIDNKILADTLFVAKENIIKQGKIATYLKQTNIFPPIAIYLIQTGEESGKLDAMLLTVAQNYETELLDYSNSLSTLLEPIMMVVMGVVVGFVVLAIMQPIMQQSEAFTM